VHTRCTFAHSLLPAPPPAARRLTCRPRAPDDERLDALLDGLDRRAPDPPVLRDANGGRAAGAGARPRPGVGAADAQQSTGCRPPGAAAVLAAELRRLSGRLGALDARARSARRGGQENRRLPALPPG
jgi:hypothetical protein